MRKSDEFHAGDVDVYQDMSSATVGPSGKICEMQLTSQVLLMCIFLKRWPLFYVCEQIHICSLHACDYVCMYSRWKGQR